MVFFMYFHTKLRVGFRSFKKMLPDIKKEIEAARAEAKIASSPENASQQRIEALYIINLTRIELVIHSDH